MAQVSLHNVEKIYSGDVRAVADFNLEVREAEFVVLVGPSGCGKTTTLRMIAGLEEITSGSIVIGERVINDVPPKDRDIAMVFQNYALYPHMTVYQNMAFGLKLRRVPRSEIARRVAWAAGMLGLEELLQRKPKALSGGQRQRVAVGRAIVRQPNVFLFDEPLSNLDARLRIETRAELKQLHQHIQTTTIYVTHDQEEAMALGDRVAVMCDGYLQQLDTPLNIYLKPANRFVAGFLGMPPMNFIEGALQAGEDETMEFQSPAVKLQLTHAQSALLKDRAGQAVSLGLRPQGLSLHANGSTSPRIQGVVRVIELLGSQMDLHLSLDSANSLVARIQAEPVTVGSHVTLYVDMEATHVFDADVRTDAAADTKRRNLTIV